MAQKKDSPEGSGESKLLAVIIDGHHAGNWMYKLGGMYNPVFIISVKGGSRN